MARSKSSRIIREENNGQSQGKFGAILGIERNDLNDVPDNIDLCYGKQKLRKRRIGGGYYGACQKQCLWREACENASREEMEFVERQLSQVPFNGDALNRNPDAAAECNKEYGAVDLSAVLEEFRYDAQTMDDAEIPGRLKNDYIMSAFGLTEEGDRPRFHEALQIMIYIGATEPKLWTTMCKALLMDMSQAEIARLEGLTRQAWNAGLMAEIAHITKKGKKHGKLDMLTPLEKAVYQVCFEDGCTVRSAAIQLRQPPVFIHRLKQRIRSKLGESETSKSNSR